MDHLLYVSTGELSLLSQVPPSARPPYRRLHCPYQVGPRCTAYDRRPLGCRVFSCQDRPAAWRQAVYEEFHLAIRQLHDGHRLPYRYVELTAALREILAPANPP
jgi:Fe-S-cluster containining protein